MNMRIKSTIYFLVCLLSITNPVSAESENPQRTNPESHPPLETKGMKHESRKINFTQPKKWTIVIYMAADNDLAFFARRNIRQLAQIGSNKNINIVVQLDTIVKNKQKVTLRYYIEKDKLILTNFDDPTSQKMDSGQPESLISCVKWAADNFPSEHIFLGFWNHGSGAIDISVSPSINPSNLFMFNGRTNLFEVNREKDFLEAISPVGNRDQRGICFDDTTGNYLTNQKMVYALQMISTNILKGKKIDIVAFDACLMSMVEIGLLIEPFALYMVGSQEVVRGTGYDYNKLLAPLASHLLSPLDFAHSIVQTYAQTYATITQDYTHAAVNLGLIHQLDQHIDTVAELLIKSLKQQKNNSVKNALQNCRNKFNCTHFMEPSYLDLIDLMENILANLKFFQYHSPSQASRIKHSLQQELQHVIATAKKVIMANVSGTSLPKAHGLSIYFPGFKLHQSYQQLNTRWAAFIYEYLLS